MLMSTIKLVAETGISAVPGAGRPATAAMSTLILHTKEGLSPGAGI